MTLILTPSDLNELEQQAPIPCPTDRVLDEFEVLTGVPEYLGRGFNRNLELSPGVWLRLSDQEYCRDWMFKEPEHDHPIQIGICLSGFIHCDIHPKFSGTCSYFSGSGVSPAYVEQNHAGERIIYVNVEIEPEVLEGLFLGDRQWQSESMRQLFKGEDWKVAFYPTVTPAIRSLAQQMWDAPYQGALRRMYLQAKVMELLVIYLDWVADDQTQTRIHPGLKPETIACLHHAKDILETRLENPPAILELAQQVGVSDRTLLRGFQQVFGTTVIGYSMQQRLNRAEQLLRQGDQTVTEVARSLGYGHLGYFATVFKRQFGITPSQCLIGKKSIL